MDNTVQIYNGEDYKKTCPNCGAAIEGEKCSYCGTLFIDFACIDARKPFYLKIKNSGTVFVAKVILNTMDMKMYSKPIIFYDNVPFQECANKEITMNFSVIDDYKESNYL